MKAFAVAPLLVLGLVGCSKAPTPVGKWNGTVKGQSLVIDFKEDKTFVAAPSAPPFPGVKLQMSGTWAQDGEKLTQTITKIDLEGLPPQFKTMVDGQMKGLLNKPQTGTVKFEGDTMTLTSPDGTQTLTRVKEEAAK